MITQTVELSGKHHEVSLNRQSKTVWIATGEYMGEHLEARGQSASSAVALWRMAARFMDEARPHARQDKFRDKALPVQRPQVSPGPLAALVRRQA